MAQIKSSFFFFFLLALLLSSVHAIRHKNPNSETTSFLSLSLHPRDSIFHPKQQNYTARIISRLAGDAARVKYINSRLSNALSNTNPDFQTEAIQSPLVHQMMGYTARLGVGQPMKEFYLLADTASEINWLQCLPCENCYPQSDPIFDPSKSTSYKPLPCASPQCKALPSYCGDNGTCNYGVLYGDQSFSEGDFATETLSFGSSDSVEAIIIGCGRHNEGFQDFAGILGLGRSAAAFPNQIKATSFSYCLVPIGSKSSSTIDFNSAAPSDSVIVPMFSNPKHKIFYYVELTGITIGEDEIPIPQSLYQAGSDGSGGIIIDSGTTVTYLNTQVYNSVRDSFKKKTQDLTPSQVNFLGFDTCYDIPSASASNTKVPAVSFEFSGGKTQL